MKETQNNPAYAVDDFEDLTRFANESFDTGDIDLFAFAGSEEQSPLTRLKSIILSLDWEITDETLEELADEIRNLTEEWRGDKVAQVYLQGLSKIGVYIQERGAYAHHNAIKLLLTFFYDFEKIVSSENLSQEDATRILKGDVRKFRILQYQIAQHEAAAADAEGRGEEWSEGYGDPDEENIVTRQLQIAVLAIDWEVTKETIGSLKDALAKLKQIVAEENRPAMILIQGLNVLGDYIAEKKADAYPESFSLLHSFSNALEQIVDPEHGELDQHAVQTLLRDHVARLQELKMIIAGHPLEPDEEEAIVEEPVKKKRPTPLEDKVVAIADTEIPSGLEVRSTEEKIRPLAGRENEKTLEDLEMEIDSFFDLDNKSSLTIADDDDDDDDDVALSRSASGEVLPALSGADLPESSENFEDPGDSGQLLDGLTDGIADFFDSKQKEDDSLSGDFTLTLDEDDSGDSALDAEVQVPAMESANSRYPDEVLPPDAIHPVDDELADDFIESSLSSKRGFTPALSSVGETSSVFAASEAIDPDMQNDLSAQLDTLFGSSESAGDLLSLEQDLELTLDSALNQDAELTLDSEPEEDAKLTLDGELESDLELTLDSEPEEDAKLTLDDELESGLELTLDSEPEEDAELTLDGELESDLELTLDSEPEEDAELTLDGELESDLELTLDSKPEEDAELTLDGELEQDFELTLDAELDEDQAFPAAMNINPIEEEDPDLLAINSRLDSFFALDDEGADPVSGEPLVEAALSTIEGDVAGFSAEPSGEKAEEAALEEDLTERLEILFDDNVAEQTGGEKAEVLAEELSPASSLESETGDVLETAVETSLVAQEEQQVWLDTLGALLPGMVQSPAPEKLDALNQAFQNLHEKNLTSNQQVFIQLLSATVTMLAASGLTPNQSSTELLVNRLYDALRVKDDKPETLMAATGSFASWVEESCKTMSTTSSMPNASEETSSARDVDHSSMEISEKVSALQDFIKEEFDKLRQELQHQNN